MDSYNVELSPTAESQLDRYIDHIQYNAADTVLSDAFETIEELETSAGSLAFCNDPDLKKLGYGKR